MLKSSDPRQKEIDDNYKAFVEMLPELSKKHANKFVVMRKKKVIDFFDTARDAMIHASKSYPDGLFSVQEVTDSVVDLGWFSHAPHYAII